MKSDLITVLYSFNYTIVNYETCQFPHHYTMSCEKALKQHLANILWGKVTRCVNKICHSTEWPLGIPAQFPSSRAAKFGAIWYLTGKLGRVTKGYFISLCCSLHMSAVFSCTDKLSYHGPENRLSQSTGNIFWRWATAQKGFCYS